MPGQHQHILAVFSAALLGAAAPPTAAAQTPAERTNIVLFFPDNLGWGEVGAYGGVRGVPTPNIDRIGEEGIRLTNFNVEYSCTVSRIALLTGRYAVRTGGSQATGMTLWEVTIADALKPIGYATGMFGKWHVGGDDWIGRREPSHQGFDEWYGIPGTSHVAQYSTFEDWDVEDFPDRIRYGDETPYIWEGRAGESARKVKAFDLANRRTIDREAAEHGIAFMERNVAQDRPFFLYYPITQIHFPTLAHPDFDGTTGAGDIGDSMADVDYNTGLVLDAIDRLGIADNTIVFWCTDNGAEQRRPWRGSAGPWRGFYNSFMEGGIRTPCLIRWPGRIPAGQVSNEIVHEVDILPTIGAAIGADIVPHDRAIDGVNQLPFLEGRQPHSNRQSVIFHAQNGDVHAVKWEDWKFWCRFPIAPGDRDPTSRIRLFQLRTDPKEETDVKAFNPWVMSVADSIVTAFEATTERYPHVPPGAPDPYTPPRGR